MSTIVFLIVELVCNPKALADSPKPLGFWPRVSNCKQVVFLANPSGIGHGQGDQTSGYSTYYPQFWP
jgi:hypothetical protein